MDYNSLNEYIKHYMEKDKSQSAILLSGDWGSGKSYYIRNVLKPFLIKKENGKHRCAIVSLYGLKDVSEISKRIYFELRTISALKKSEFFSYGEVASKVVAKTILNGMTNMIGFDIGKLSDMDLANVYSSIKLTNVLIVFEDIERSEIDIVEILGYVNNLVEYDQAKVLLVANENEIQNSQDVGLNIYQKIKEKTISDTLVFNADLENAIRTIILSYENSKLDKFCSSEDLKKISHLMMVKECFNFRLFIVACQKVIDIYEILENLHRKEDFLPDSVFYGVVSMFLSKKNGVYPTWNSNRFLSFELGFEEYPLYRFCYDYIRWQEIDYSTIISCIYEHKNLLDLNISSPYATKSLDIVHEYYIHLEKEVREALDNIENYFIQNMQIGFNYYATLAADLIKCNSAFDYDYSKCKKKMINSIIFLEDKFFTELLDGISWQEENISFEDDEQKKLYFNFLDELIDAIYSKLKDTSSLYYELREIKKYFRYKFINRGNAFISRLDLSKLLNTFFKSSPNELYKFRAFFREIYQNSKKGEFIEGEYIFMKDLKNLINEKLNECRPYLDKIKIYQIENFVKDLMEYIEILE